MTDTDRDTWPTREDTTFVRPRETVVGGEPPPPPPPYEPAPARRFGAGMLLALTVIALAVTGAAIAYFLTHEDKGSQVTTVVERSTAPTAGPTSTPAATTAPSTTPSATTSPSTTSPSTTSPSTTSPSTTPTTPAEPTSATMPDVSSRKESSAVQALSQAGILPSLVFVPAGDPLGTVTGQAKAAGTTVPYHSHVQINISSGPGDKPQERVPSVIGQTLQEAVSSVNGAHLRLIYVKYPVSSRSQAGKVIQQSPLGGGHAPQNAQVLVFLGAFRG